MVVIEHAISLAIIVRCGTCFCERACRFAIEGAGLDKCAPLPSVRVRPVAVMYLVMHA